MPVEHGQLHEAPKPPKVKVTFSTEIAESALAFVEGKPNGEQESEAAFEKNFEQATETANPDEEECVNEKCKRLF